MICCIHSTHGHEGPDRRLLNPCCCQRIPQKSKELLRVKLTPFVPSNNPIVTRTLSLTPTLEQHTSLQFDAQNGDQFHHLTKEVITLFKVIREIVFTTLLAKVVLVKKHNDKWHTCVDYKDLIKACPKDTYMLPNIDWLVDNTTGYDLLSFLDTYSR